MSQKEYKFKTTINCSGCEAKVRPHLDALHSITEWKVDTSDKLKVLSVQCHDEQPDAIMEVVRAAGFRIEVLNEQ